MGSLAWRLNKEGRFTYLRGNLVYATVPYTGFNDLFAKDKLHEMACMAHVRRKFVDIFQSQGSQIAEESIRRIALLYAVEKAARGKSPDERVALRQRDAKPVFDELAGWLDAQLNRSPANPNSQRRPDMPSGA